MFSGEVASSLSADRPWLRTVEAAVLALPTWPVAVYMLIGAGVGFAASTALLTQLAPQVQSVAAEAVRDVPPFVLQGFPTLPPQATPAATRTPTARPTVIPTRVPVLLGTPIPFPSPAPDASPAASPFRR